MKIAEIMGTYLRKYFLFGLVVLLPFFIAIMFLLFVVDYFDAILAIRKGHFLYAVPERFHPDQLLGFHVPGLGIVFTVLVVFFTGVLSRNYLGKRLIRLGDSIIGNIPLARGIYKVVKEAIRTYGARKRDQFSNVVLVEYPRKGLYTLAFVTGTASQEVQDHTNVPTLNVFVPTSPNPTSGFLIMVPEADVQKLEISVESAFRLIVSGGIVTPGQIASDPQD